MSNSEKRQQIAQDICNSEAFARLMVGSSTIDAELSALRILWREYVAVNGGYGKGRERREEKPAPVRDKKNRFSR